ncbi:SIR2 family protein [Polaromonas sp. SP1]|uniref:SIR2 family NAD-dependent protein deacylase n=1 Tax=Polaromonas sp. SP1 TaxID=2268087 RepID=UPI0013DDD358|nr:SIR2 family protein [Polaromonas sp. SP1]
MKNTSSSEIHLTSLRRALESGNAAVMVGAGFSRNAEGGHQLATWAGMAQELWATLNPGVPAPAFSSGLVTQLGEQYCRAFSTTDLEDLLKRLVPDERVSPGQLHDDLLRLPWTEIFTTNYDTLLERAADNIIERAHFAVLCREDIPRSKVLGKRRIVKLHGSFPSQRPFIFSEEDYRTYPEKFSPFVNMVRQSLLENVFCLVGFSGEDPNFLHWIGWVRDMLDKHTLPIYLFVSKEPSYGELKLLESRKVTPVVLPQVGNEEDTDIGQRYKELFRILGQPLQAADSEWGSFKVAPVTSAFSDDVDEIFSRMLDALPPLLDLRSTYPGWLVAPKRTRRNFENSLRSVTWRFEDHLIRKKITALNPVMTVVLLAQYAWQQEVLLEPLTDSLGEIAFQQLLASAGWNISEGSDELRESLEKLRITKQKAFKDEWIFLAVNVLRWKRQQIEIDGFNKLKTSIELIAATDRFVLDQVRYEEILLYLYLGELDVAESKLSSWIPNSGDAYMAIRKGALLAEVGDLDAGLAACLDGIQRLRVKQKTNLSSAKFLSEEAWACHICLNIQRAQKFDHRVDLRDGFGSPEKLSQRLTDLAGRGYDVQREQEELIEGINTEAALPTEAELSFDEFDLGHISSSRRFGMPSELRNKLGSSLRWLEFVDRVAIVSRAGQVSFDLASHVQAAWWAQYVENWPRILSIPIRGRSLDALKPFDTSGPAHKTGWFSRFQIGVLDLKTAQEMCQRSFRQVEAALASQREDRSIQHICEFHLELFSRLVLRCTDSTLLIRFADRLMDFHKEQYILRHPQLWKKFGKALARCIEALDPKLHKTIAVELFSLPVFPTVETRDHLLDDWLRWTVVLQHFRPGSFASDEVTEEIQQVIKQLKASPAKPDRIRRKQNELLWNKLIGSSSLKLLTAQQEKEVSNLLWGNKSSWPTLPAFEPTLATLWPAPKGIDANAQFREWILTLTLQPMQAPKKSSGGRLRKAWTLSDRSEFLTSWARSQRRADWPVSDVAQGLGIIRQWWVLEWEDITWDVVESEEVAACVRDRLGLIDLIIGRSIDPDALELLVVQEEVGEWLAEMIEGGLAIGAHFWCCRLALAAMKGDSDSLALIEQEISTAFLCGKKADIYDAYRTMIFWIDRNAQLQKTQPTLALNAIGAVVGSRRSAALTYCLDLLVRVSKQRKDWCSGGLLAMVHVALKNFQDELRYEIRVNPEHLQGDIPFLRFKCTELVRSLLANGVVVPDVITSAWIDWIAVDPLPEIRFIEDRQ